MNPADAYDVGYAPAVRDDNERPWCALCHSLDGNHPLDDPHNDRAYVTTTRVPNQHVQGRRLFSGLVPVFAVACEVHEVAWIYHDVIPGGWTRVRIRTPHGLANGRVPESELVWPDHAARPTPDGYDHIVYFDPEYTDQSCSVCGDRAIVYARDPPDPDAVAFPRGGYFCEQHAAER